MTQALGDEDGRVRCNAVEAVEKLGGHLIDVVSLGALYCSVALSLAAAAVGWRCCYGRVVAATVACGAVVAGAVVAGTGGLPWHLLYCISVVSGYQCDQSAHPLLQLLSSPSEVD